MAQNNSVIYTPFQITLDNGVIIASEKGSITVPENRAAPNGNTIQLHFVRLKSTAAKPGYPVIYLSGGPGESGINTLKTEKLLVFEALRKFGDVIVPDQRGTGITQPILTSDESLKLPLDKPVDDAESLKIFYQRMQATADELKKNNIDINSYNTKENAADINELRKALGADKMVLWGHSYGSHLGIAVVKYFGDNVEKAILSSVNGLEQRFRMPGDADVVFNEMDKLIDKEPKLRKLIPSLPLLVKEQLQKLEQPVTVDINENNKKISVTVGRADVELFTVLNLGSISFIRELPQLFYNMSRGNYNVAGFYTYRFIKNRPEGTPMRFGIHYASGYTGERNQKISEQSKTAILRNAVNFPFMNKEVEDIWKIKELGDEFIKSFSSDVPVLLVSGNLDGRTSISDANEVRKNFSNAVQVIFKNASHDLLAPQLITAMEEFMNGQLKADITYEVPGFDFYSINAMVLSQELSKLIKDEGLEAFKNRYIKLCSPESDTYVSNTFILLPAYQLIRQKKPELAIDALKVNMEIFKDKNWQVYNALGDAYTETGNREMAIASYETAFALNPLNFKAYKELKKLK